MEVGASGAAYTLFARTSLLRGGRGGFPRPRPRGRSPVCPEQDPGASGGGAGPAPVRAAYSASSSSSRAVDSPTRRYSVNSSLCSAQGERRARIRRMASSAVLPLRISVCATTRPDRL
ncbi:Hypothetical Protein sle_24350 [Streptomyces leeuwenhoekii]|uniref:Uncharacterized protein n=1 Tax=Streptomyces leeuwenhoekii TaxID=1437453 RepID=A0A0F7VYL9_STRLW|nr:Hypothetical Protein sle_24350 [Streptomyces leeuwenhoekii]